MDVLNILLVLGAIALAGVALFFGYLVLWFVFGVLWMWAPVAVGIPVAAWLWNIGHDNLAALTALVALVVQFRFWPAFHGKGSGDHHYDPLEGKTKLYDKEGHVIGGKDKE